VPNQTVHCLCTHWPASRPVFSAAPSPPRSAPRSLGAGSGRAAQIRIKAELKAGELLVVMQNNGGRQKQGGDRRSKSRDASLKTLDDLNLSADQSSRWQQLAENPKAREFKG
jgi:hypothetical protein